MHDRPNGICSLAKCRIQRTKENEEKVLNLHNHLIWKSYERGKDDVTDAIMDEAERLAESEESSPFALR